MHGVEADKSAKQTNAHKLLLAGLTQRSEDHMVPQVAQEADTKACEPQREQGATRTFFFFFFLSF
jgi:hypothetical protein